jgi:hypothetical protein
VRSSRLMKSNLTSATCGTEDSRGLSGRREVAPVNPGHRPSASALGSRPVGPVLLGALRTPIKTPVRGCPQVAPGRARFAPRFTSAWGLSLSEPAPAWAGSAHAWARCARSLGPWPLRLGRPAPREISSPDRAGHSPLRLGQRAHPLGRPPFALGHGPSPRAARPRREAKTAQAWAQPENPVVHTARVSAEPLDDSPCSPVARADLAKAFAAPPKAPALEDSGTRRGGFERSS